MWEILSEGAMGFVVLIDSLRADPLADLETYLRGFGVSIAKCRNAVVIGVTRLEQRGEIRLLDRLRERLEALHLEVPVFEVDGRSRDDVKILLLALLALIDPRVSVSQGAR